MNDCTKERCPWNAAIFQDCNMTNECPFYVKMKSPQKALQVIKKYCEAHPTCKSCDHNKKYIGCDFRGKSPREWQIKEH
jgi:hypothetical protein